MNPEQEVARSQKRMGLGMLALAWVVIIGLVGWFFNDMLAARVNPNSNVASSLGADGVREVVLQRNRYGHYVASGEINGQPVTFMLDTGATGVAIPPRIASQLGLRRGMAYQSETANGSTLSYATQLERVALGDIVMQEVPAAIVTGMEFEQVLLGMTFLKHIEFSQRGDQLTLRQYPQANR
ncbi:TIGR02281 family clan AA aspartic protease [Mangrovimicrobium sediminis]|uniref:TIGR02281 family clan AA aspartic protease n=1 Tax=Mangrovimicrobium sediminis TaxID=2562682 RepID=A0A4Z0M8K8_9GAMM|nr:TIGR02281 family clan AA aspartic protease [Haliea sp. SAOS-164]TGD76043.1 TIGR02281 family clan AA aspartic protease [Haliea sp. SAOS-164]